MGHAARGQGGGQWQGQPSMPAGGSEVGFFVDHRALPQQPTQLTHSLAALPLTHAHTQLAWPARIY